jgi:hypothetical protein
MSGPKRKQRKKIFVSSQIQGRMLARFASYWVLYHVVLWHAMFLCRYLEYRETLLSGGTAVPLGTLYGTFLNDHASLIGCAAALSPIIFWDMLKLTHRIAGPLVRVERTLRTLTEGRPAAKLKLRRGDLPIGLQDALNSYLDTQARRSHCFGGTSEQSEAVEGRGDRVLAEIHSMLAGHDPAHESEDWGGKRPQSSDLHTQVSDLHTEVVVG